MKQKHFLFLLSIFYSIIMMGEKMEQIFKTLTQLIKDNNNIFIMTHKNPEFDGIGSAIGLQQIINSFKKNSYIILNGNEKNKSLIKSYNLLKENKLYFNTVMKTKATNLIKENTLLIILDTHKQDMTEVPVLINKTNNIVVIDHHIKSKDYIKEASLTYINANLSSTVEFMTNYIKYLNKTVDSLIATFMLVGLEIDTNNFRLKTTKDTYEAASFLLELGADNVLKQELLQENKNDYLKRQKLIEKSYMINDNMALCVADNELYESKDLAYIAEQLLQFENVTASFVIGHLTKDIIGISARSLGNVNVEEIMAKLGGGGHLTEAATQIKNSTLKKVEQQLIEQIGGKK